MRALFYLLLILLSYAPTAFAAPSAALGYTPKYPPDFSHFDYVNPDAPKGGHLTLASLSNNFDSLNPFLLKGNAGDGISMLVFESLMESSSDEPYSLYGVLADDIALAEDGLSVTFRLNQKATFSDGSPVTPEDVKFSFDTLKGKQAHPYYRIVWSDVTEAVILDERHIKFNFAKRNPELHLMIAGLPVFPKAWVGDKPFDEVIMAQPIGSGPYVLADYQLNKNITLKRNPNYWGHALNVRKGMFNFDKITFKYYKDRTISLEAFKAGEFDFISVYSSKHWARDYKGKHFDSGAIKKAEIKHQNNEAIQGFVFNTRRKLFEDKRVREALNYVFDFEWANRMLFYGQYTRSNSYFSNSELAARGLPSEAELALLEPYREQLDPRVFSEIYEPPKTTPPSSLRENLLKAKRLLNQAGWHYQDGALRDEAGNAFEFDLMLSSKAFERIAASYARNLQILGIKMNYRVVDQALYRRRMETFDFDMLVVRYGQKQSPGNELINRWHSNSADVEGSENHPGIKNPVIDALLEKLIKAESRQELITIAHAMDRVLLYDFYLVPQWYIPYHRIAYWDKFDYPETLPKYFNVTAWMIATWWMKPEFIQGDKP